ncbi:hypothetical protein ABK040_014183 [Willaertia magna]
MNMNFFKYILNNKKKDDDEISSDGSLVSPRTPRTPSFLSEGTSETSFGKSFSSNTSVCSDDLDLRKHALHKAGTESVFSAGSTDNRDMRMRRRSFRKTNSKNSITDASLSPSLASTYTKQFTEEAMSHRIEFELETGKNVITKGDEVYVPFSYAKQQVQGYVNTMNQMRTQYIASIEHIDKNYQEVEKKRLAQMKQFVDDYHKKYRTLKEKYKNNREEIAKELAWSKEELENQLKSEQERCMHLLEEKKELLVSYKGDIEEIEKEHEIEMIEMYKRFDEQDSKNNEKLKQIQLEITEYLKKLEEQHKRELLNCVNQQQNGNEDESIPKKQYEIQKKLFFGLLQYTRNLKKSLDAMAEVKMELLTQIQKLDVEYQETLVKFEEERQQHQFLMDENKRLKNEILEILEQSSAKDADIESWKEQLDKLQKVYQQQLESSITQEMAFNIEKQMELQQWRERFELTEVELEHNKKRGMELNQKILELESTLIIKEKACEELQEQIEKLLISNINNNNDQDNHLVVEANFKKKLEEEGKRSHQLEQTIEKLEEQNVFNEQQIVNLKNTIETLKSLHLQTNDSSKKDAIKIAELESIQNELSNKNLTLETNNSKLVQQVDELKHEINVKNKEYTQLEEEKLTAIESLTSEISTLKTELDDLKQRYKNINSIDIENESEISQVRKVVEEQFERIEALEEENHELTMKIVLSKGSTQALTQPPEEKYKKLFIKYKSSYAQIKDSVLTLTNKLNSTEDKLVIAKKEISRLEQELALCNTKDDEIQQVLHKYRTEVQEHKTEIGSLNTIISSLNSEIKELKQINLRNQTKASDVESALKKSLGQNLELIKHLEENLKKIWEENKTNAEMFKEKIKIISDERDNLKALVDDKTLNESKAMKQVELQKILVGSLNDEISNLNRQLEQARDLSNSYKTTKETLEIDIEKYIQKTNLLEAKNLELKMKNEKDSNSLKMEYENRVRMLKEENELKIKEEKTESLKKTQQLSETVQNLQKTNDLLKEQLQISRTSVRKLTEKIELLSEEAKRVNDLGSQINELNEKLKEKDTHLDATQKLILREKKKYSELERIYKETDLERRKLHNEKEDSKGKIRVYARCRPMDEEEIRAKDTNIVSFIDDTRMMIIPKQKEFTFNRVFDDRSSQDEVFEETKDLVQSAFDGYNVCVFAYGQTGSGKTFTISGSDSSEELRGLLPRSIEHLYSIVEKNKRTFTTKIKCYVLELYNDELRDLFAPKKNPLTKQSELEIKKDERGNVIVPKATIKEATNLSELMSIYLAASKNRMTRATDMNEASSRSHLIFSILIESVHLRTGDKIEGKLTMVDLAGSERRKKTNMGEEGNKESLSINKSLLALGDVISALSEEKTHIPYRNNKLTMLLSDSLGGNAKTLMIVCIGPSSYNLEESVTSLAYATRVKNIKNSVNRNTENKEIQRLKKEILRLRKLSGEGTEEEIKDIKELSPLTPRGTNTFVSPITPRSSKQQ